MIRLISTHVHDDSEPNRWRLSLGQPVPPGCSAGDQRPGQGKQSRRSPFGGLLVAERGVEVGQERRVGLGLPPANGALPPHPGGLPASCEPGDEGNLIPGSSPPAISVRRGLGGCCSLSNRPGRAPRGGGPAGKSSGKEGRGPFQGLPFAGAGSCGHPRALGSRRGAFSVLGPALGGGGRKGTRELIVPGLKGEEVLEGDRGLSL